MNLRPPRFKGFLLSFAGEQDGVVLDSGFEMRFLACGTPVPGVWAAGEG